MTTDGGLRSRIDFSFLRSRVARRVFFLFVTAALAPIVVTVLLVFTYVRAELLDDATRRLAEQSKSYGLERFSRVQQAGDALGRLMRSASQTRALAEPELPRLIFRRLSVVADGEAPRELIGRPLPLPNIDGFAQRWLEKHNPVVVTLRQRDGSATVLVLRRGYGARGSELWLAEIDPEFLWDPVDQPTELAYLVIDSRGNVLYATRDKLRSIGAPQISLLLAQQRGTTRSLLSEGGSIFSSWRVFMRPTFGVEGWTAVVVADEASVLAPMSAFARIYPPVLAATLLIVILMSLVQIRRSHAPLEKIVAGTRRLAARDYGSRIEIRDDTEYAELATAFNDMSARVEKQFVALRTLADVDRLMLTSRNLEPVLEAILTYMRGTLRCSEVVIVLTDAETADIGHMYRPRADGTGIAIERTRLGAEVLQSLVEHRDGKSFLCSADPDKQTPFHQFVGARAGMTTTVVPVIPALSVAGVVAALFDQSAPPDADALAFMRDTADRLAVALANDARQRALIRQAHFDGLTGLPNRELFRDRLNQELLRAAREKKFVALLFIDLDRFKHVNDSTGHTAGDKLLRIAAARIQASVEESDTVARLGGDEFTVLLANAADTSAAARVADRILADLAQPFALDGVEHYLTASIGIACAPGDGQNTEQLLKNADMAMYRAKSNGRGSYAFFEEAMNTVATRRLQLESQLRRAIDNDELQLHYQPQIHLLSGRIVSAEALVRWQHPTLGLVPPGHFIPLAEDSGLILQIGDWVIREALRQLAVWRAGDIPLSHIAVNVSTRQLRNVEFADRVLRELERANTPGQFLELEITESGLMENMEITAQRLMRLRSRCVRIAIDDFGTGYSSLNYLRDLPFDAIKIDRSFLKNIHSPDGAAIADAVIAMAHALGKQVVAEGVELPAQLTYLRAHRCDLAQGYHFGRPVPAEEFATMFRNWRDSTRTSVAASA